MIVVLAADTVTTVAVHACRIALAVQFNTLRLLTIALLWCETRLPFCVVFHSGCGGCLCALRARMLMILLVLRLLLLWWLFAHVVFVDLRKLFKILKHEHLKFEIVYIVHVKRIGVVHGVIVVKNAIVQRLMKRITLRHAKRSRFQEAIDNKMDLSSIKRQNKEQEGGYLYWREIKLLL